jgi:hypothetical protein
MLETKLLSTATEVKLCSVGADYCRMVHLMDASLTNALSNSRGNWALFVLLLIQMII